MSRMRALGWVVLGVFVLAWWACTQVGPVQPEGASGQEGQQGGNTELLVEPVADSPASKPASSDTGAEPVTPGVEPTTPGPEPTSQPEPGQQPEPTLPDAGPVPEAPPEVLPEGIKAPSQQWTWVDVPGSKCGNGSQTGFAINPNPGATRLYIYFQGGGACWDQLSCNSLAPTAFNITGFDGNTFKRDLVTQQNIRSFFFRRDTAANVFSKDHYVFIPYCSGDVFSGDSKVTFNNGKTMYFQGHRNVKLFLSKIIPTFPKVKHVVIAGSSAGGFGAALNWWLVQQRFGNGVRVDLIDDSGPPIQPPESRWKPWVNTWKMNFPPSCPDCSKGVDKLLTHYKNTLIKQGRKMAFLTYDRDSIIRTFFDLNNLFGTKYQGRINDLFDEMDTIKGAHYYGLPGSSHTLMILGPENIKNKKQVALTTWIEWMVKGDPAWTSQRP